MNLHVQCDTDDKKRVCIVLSYENNKTGETSLSLVMFGRRHHFTSNFYAYFSIVVGADVKVIFL